MQVVHIVNFVFTSNYATILDLQYNITQNSYDYRLPTTMILVPMPSSIPLTYVPDVKQMSQEYVKPPIVVFFVCVEFFLAYLSDYYFWSRLVCFVFN